MTEKHRDSEWIEGFNRLLNNILTHVKEVHDAIKSEDELATTEALKNAQCNTPGILDELKSLPSPKDKKLKDSHKKLKNAVKVFLDGCKYGVEYLEKPTPWNRSVWWITAEIAENKIEEANALFCYCCPDKTEDKDSSETLEKES